MSLTPSKPTENQTNSNNTNDNKNTNVTTTTTTPLTTTNLDPSSYKTPNSPVGREQRGSLQKLVEEKKVGKILGFFENLSTTKKEKPADVPEPKVYYLFISICYSYFLFLF